MPDPKKKYPVTNPNERKPNVAAGSGTLKQTSDDSGKKYYHRNPDTGKMEEYKATRYVDDKKKKAAIAKPPAPEPVRSRPRFSGSMGDHGGKYLHDLYNHTTGVPAKKK